jgi:hypothetical protein
MSEGSGEAVGMYGSTAMDTIAGSKLLQVRFGSSFVLQPDQSVMHEDRRARFIRMSDGAALIRYCGDSVAVPVPPESLSLPDADESKDGAPTLRPRHHVAPRRGRRTRVTRARGTRPVFHFSTGDSTGLSQGSLLAP